MDIRLGLKENWRQFSLLVLVNGFVGAMVGMERVVIPVLAESTFGLESYAAVLSFIITFGSAKALSNLLSGRLADGLGRKRLLVLGWIVGIPVPLILLWAPTWGWIVFANVLLGINQGFSWTMTVVMKIDMVGARRRGLALGINESAGYGAVSIAALVSGLMLASGSVDSIFIGGTVVAILGLLVSVVLVRDTSQHVALEQAHHEQADEPGPSFNEVFRETSWSNRNMFAASQAGLVNNLNDGLAWGILPLFFLSVGLSLERTSWLLAVYPFVWGVGQLGTGWLADHIGRKIPIVLGMMLQGVSLIGLVFAPSPAWYFPAMVGQGLGTALVYPSLLAVISDNAAPAWRSTSLGVYRLWRDGGYVVGAVIAGLLADSVGLNGWIAAIGALTIVSGFVSLARLEADRNQ